MKHKPRLLDWRQRVGQVKELGARLKPTKGSILVYTLVILAIMLSTALSIFAVAVRDKKSAGGTADSTQAFNVADSGLEKALHAIYKYRNNPNFTVGQVGTSCNNDVVAFSLYDGEVQLIFYSDEDSAEVIPCTGRLSDARKVKSAGSYKGYARAVEVAVAGSEFVDNGCIEPCDINSYPEGKTCSLIKGGENICADGDGCLAYLIGKFDSRPKPQLAYLYQNRSNNYIDVYSIDAGNSGTNGDTGPYADDSQMLYFGGVAVAAEGGVFDDYKTNERDPDKVYLWAKSDKGSPARLIICDEGTAP